MKSVCGLVGSLRKGSFNRGLMLAAMDAGTAAGLDIHIFERLDEVPPYNADYDTDPLRPAVVNALKSAIGDADALIVATPEYNYNVPGFLKNAIDWASRPAGKSPLNRKPAAIMGASTGMSGTIRAQLALRQSFLFTDTFAMLQPEVLIPKCTDRFDENGILVDQSTRDLIARQMQTFVKWISAIEPMTRAGTG